LVLRYTACPMVKQYSLWATMYRECDRIMFICFRRVAKWLLFAAGERR
jgi:hypothetical protein